MKVLWIFAAAFAVLCGKAVAHVYCDIGCFEIRGEWLYFLPSIDESYYAIETGTDSIFTGERRSSSQRWHSGYRLEGIYYCPNGMDQLHARWTHFPHFSERDQDTNVLGILNPPFFPVNTGTFAEIQERFCVYNLEALWERSILFSSPFTLNFDAGIGYARIDFNEKIIYLDATTGAVLVENQSIFRGVGPELVLDFSYDLFKCLSFKGRTGTALIVNKRRTNVKCVTTLGGGTIASTKDQPYWYVTPLIDIRFGLNATRHFWDLLKVEIELGYEVIHCVKAIDRIWFVDMFGAGPSEIQHMDFSMHGPYLQLGVSY